MLFCAPSDVNDVWSLVAKATVDNTLGVAAKVAPRSPLEDPRKDRLICVYTSDFSDKPDIGRVLQRLRELHLVETKFKQIYYKPGKLLSSSFVTQSADKRNRHIHALGNIQWKSMGAQGIYL